MNQLIDLLFLIIKVGVTYLQTVKFLEDGGAEDDEEDEPPDTDGVEKRVLISCCWRSVQIGGALLSESLGKILQLPVDYESVNVVSLCQRTSVLFNSILRGVRHWGVANSTQKSLTVLCIAMNGSDQLNISNLPNIWLKVLSSATPRTIHILIHMCRTFLPPSTKLK